VSTDQPNAIRYEVLETYRDAIAHEAQLAAPKEAVGLVWRTPTTYGFMQFTNQSEVDGAYEVPDDEQVDALLMLESVGADMSTLGIWHSHPTADARPSEVDCAHAEPDWTYLIYSVRERALRAWRVIDGAAVEQLISIVPA
jgi:proteasome lid subunit RPN8/RPN11